MYSSSQTFVPKPLCIQDLTIAEGYSYSGMYGNVHGKQNRAWPARGVSALHLGRERDPCGKM